MGECYALHFGGDGTTGVHEREVDWQAAAGSDLAGLKVVEIAEAIIGSDVELVDEVADLAGGVMVAFGDE